MPVLLIVIGLLLSALAFWGAYTFFYPNIFGIGKTDTSADRHSNLLSAVQYRNIGEVERLIASGADLNVQNERMATPLILAITTDQYEIAEVLIDAGADIFAYDKFGITAGNMIEQWNPTLPSESSEARAREHVLRKLTEKGFPFPAPSREETLEMVAEGTWPPKQ